MAHPREKEYAWLRAHAAEYPGQWLAVLDDRLIAADASFVAVKERVQQHPDGGRAGLHFQPAWQAAEDSRLGCALRELQAEAGRRGLCAAIVMSPAGWAVEWSEQEFRLGERSSSDDDPIGALETALKRLRECPE